MSQDTMENLKRMGYVFLLAAWFFNTLGGTAYHLYNGQVPFALSNIIVSLSIIPTVRGWFKKLT